MEGDEKHKKLRYDECKICEMFVLEKCICPNKRQCYDCGDKLCRPKTTCSGSGKRGCTMVGYFLYENRPYCCDCWEVRELKTCLERNGGR